MLRPFGIEAGRKTAAARGVVDALLSKGANRDDASDSGETALMYPAEAGRLECVRLLIAHGSDIAAKDNRGKTAEAFALDNKHYDIARLLKAAGAK